MALTLDYTNSQTMKKLNVNGNIYWLKDADLRAIVEGFSDAVYKSVDTTFDKDSVNLATSKAIADYIADEITDLEGAMHFVGVVERQEGETDAQAIARTQTAPAAGDVLVMKDNSKEYIYTGSAWEEVGDQSIYLTIATAAATYVPKTTTIAGIDLQDNITVEELSASSALNLKALAHKDTASGTVSTIDSFGDLTIPAAGTYTVAGNSVAVPKTYDALDVPPAGSVTITPGTAAAATYDKVSGVSISSGSVPEGGTANYTPAGTISLPSLVTTGSVTTTSVATVSDAGTAYTMTSGAVTQGNDSTAKVAIKTVEFAMDGTDAEQLNLSYVPTSTTASGWYTDGVTASGTVSYTAPTLSGSLPTFGTATVADGISDLGSSYNGDPSFTGTGVVLSTSVATSTANATVTQPTFSAAFSGTTKSVTPTVATTENAQAPSGTITLTTTTVSIQTTSSNKTVTVS